MSFHWNLSDCFWFYILYLIYIWRPLVVVHWSPSPTLCTLDNKISSGNLFLVSLYIEAKEIGRFFKIDVLLISILAATVRDIAIVRGGFWLFFQRSARVQTLNFWTSKVEKSHNFLCFWSASARTHGHKVEQEILCVVKQNEQMEMLLTDILSITSTSVTQQRFRISFSHRKT